MRSSRTHVTWTLGITQTELSILLMECNRIVGSETEQEQGDRPTAVYVKFKFERPLFFVHSAGRQFSTGYHICLLLNSLQVLSH